MSKTTKKRPARCGVCLDLYTSKRCPHGCDPDLAHPGRKKLAREKKRDRGAGLPTAFEALS